MDALAKCEGFFQLEVLKFLVFLLEIPIMIFLPTPIIGLRSQPSPTLSAMTSTGFYPNLQLEFSKSFLNFSTPTQLDQMTIRNCSINGSTGVINYYSNLITNLVGACNNNIKVPVVTPAAPTNLTEGGH